MLKFRIWGKNEEIEKMIELICNGMPTVRVLSVSGYYKDRGASVYERCYLDVELNGAVTADAIPKSLKKLPDGSSRK